MSATIMHSALAETIRQVPDTQRSSQVLVVDDEPAIQRLMKAVLEEEGYSCCTAGGCADAIGQLASRDFDLLLSDVHMPDGTGIDLAQFLLGRGLPIPVILLTGTGDLQTAVDALKFGVNDYLLKPVRPAQLLNSVRKSLESSRLERELELYRHRLEEMVSARTAELDRALKELKLTYDATLHALGMALDYRDHETQGHCQRVADMSRGLASQMGIAGDELVAITYGAYLHDIGKMAIPDSILLKPGALTAEEQSVMRGHVEIGHKMLQSIPFLRCAAKIVLAHHERFDGSGYPHGLAGKQIPIGARIFVVADTVDAITSERPYRKARPFSAARDEIIRCSGTQFDPDIVEMFLLLPATAAEKFR